MDYNRQSASQPADCSYDPMHLCALHPSAAALRALRRMHEMSETMGLFQQEGILHDRAVRVGRNKQRKIYIVISSVQGIVVIRVLCRQRVVCCEEAGWPFTCVII